MLRNDSENLGFTFEQGYRVPLLKRQGSIRLSQPEESNPRVW